MGGHEDLGESTQTPAERATETTNISLPPAPEAPAVAHTLSTEEREAVAALPGGSALLIAHDGPNRGARFLLDEEVTTAGRHPEADIFLDDVTVSRRHAEFRRTESGFDVADAGSLNGTYVNHDRVDAVALRTGAEVRIGKFRLTFYAGAQAS
ncbi:FHA domain-containing protein [Zhihengliuella halotolerans]|uniref:Type III secretion system (T3SS) inner membrane Yop/YscD-like protein n=1 Tax=Zhihengliuella halotolerans TaxID=370736 RepID=A0A4Q8AC80_9MICC|nr:FHA domain-containing protein [Zhihengliuella halotolerans]RZU61792.1 type III secretion system (T3SS) inner membrane Yop/YscD-like protein [Zhihengliuella halotolerans]